MESLVILDRRAIIVASQHRSQLSEKKFLSFISKLYSHYSINSDIESRNFSMYLMGYQDALFDEQEND